VVLKTFPKRHKITSIIEFAEGTQQAELTDWFAGDKDEFLTYADTTVNRILVKIESVGRPLSLYADVQRGVTPFKLTNTREHKNSVRAFNGTVRRYHIEYGPRRFIRFDNTLAEPKPERYFIGSRILLRELISRQFQLQAVKITEDFVTNKSMQSILGNAGGPQLSFLLGCVNSHMLSWYFLRKSNIAQRDDFPKIVLKETRSLPIPPINISDPADKVKHDKMVALVDSMLELHKQLAAANSEAQKIIIQRQIDATDAEIDRLVYDLYGLTAEEIALVEGASAKRP
jgi:hypothetical protein